MKNILCSLAVLLIIAGNIQAESYIVDSLQTKLMSLKGKDKVTSLIRIADSLYSIDPALSLKLYLEAQNEAVLTGNKAFEADVNLILGIQHRYIGRFNESIDFLSKALKYYGRTKNKHKTAEALIELSRTYTAIGSMDKALDRALKALKTAGNLKNQSLVATVNNEVGTIYSMMKQYNQAMDFFLNSVSIYQNTNDELQLAVTYSNIGNVYLKQNQIYKALDFQMQALKLADKSNRLEFKILLNIGDCYFNDNKFDKAIAYYERAQALAEEISFEGGKADAMLSISESLIAIGKFAPARKLLNNSEPIYYSENNYSKLADVYKLLSQAEEALGHTKDAFQYFKIYKRIQDSINSDEQAEMLYRLQVEFELDNTNSKLAASYNEAQLQKELVKSRDYIILGVALFALSFVFVAMYLYNNFRKNKLMSDNLRVLNHALEDKNSKLILSENILRETNAIKDKLYSIIAHDIRNPLNPIGVGIEILKQRGNMNIDSAKQDKVINDIGKAIKMLGDLLENLLQWTNFQKGTMPFNPIYLSLYQIIESNKILFAQNIKQKSIILFSDIKENDMIFADFNMINAIIRNLVSNAIKYTSHGGIIKISSNRKPDVIEISVIDTGVGMPEEIVNQLFRNDSFVTSEGTNFEKGTGLGLKICKEFVEKHQGTIICRSLVNSGSTFKFSIPQPGL